MCDQIKLVGRKGSLNGSGTYPNMFDAHLPFQIDGNFGFTSGLTEMLVQRQDGAIQLLFALTDVWDNGVLIKVIIKSNIGGNCRIRSYNKLKADGETDFKIASGVNENPFYQTPAIQKPIISEKAKLKGINIPETFLYDIATKPGQKVVLVQKEE